MKKKQNKYKEQISRLENTVSSNDRYIRELNSFKNRLQAVLDIKDGYSSEDLMVREVLNLVSFRRYHEGAINEVKYSNERLMDIIRWEINPASAEQSKELEYYKKGRGL